MERLLGALFYSLLTSVIAITFMDYTTRIYITIGSVFVAWAAFAFVVSLVAAGRIISHRRWSLPEHRLILGGVFLILSGLVAMSTMLIEFDKFIQPVKFGFPATLADMKKTGTWDEPTIELIRTASERTVDAWVRFRDLLNNLILLVSGGVGGGLVAQGVIEKHQRRVRDQHETPNAG